MKREKRGLEALAQEVVPCYLSCSSSFRLAPLGKGNINDTFLVRADGQSFVLQRLNSEVFPDLEGIIENSRHIVARLAACEGLEVAEPVFTRDGEAWSRDSEGSLWRAQKYIPHTSFATIQDARQAASLGGVLGRFHRHLRDFPLSCLVEPLPNFHNTPEYLKKLDSSLVCHRERADSWCLRCVEEMRPRAAQLEEAQAAGRLHPQPVHGDPKCDNFIFNRSGQAVGLLDLDTVGPGLIQYDLGDCLRSCCNRAGEYGRKAEIDQSLFRAVLRGYFSEAGTYNAVMIYESLLLISFELGLRFFTDHLQGNRYFKVVEDGVNLQRAQQQFQLVANIRAHEEVLREIIREETAKGRRGRAKGY